MSKLVLEVFPDYSMLLVCDSKKWYGNIVEMEARVINLTLNNCTSIMEHKKGRTSSCYPCSALLGLCFPHFFSTPGQNPKLLTISLVSQHFLGNDLATDLDRPDAAGDQPHHPLLLTRQSCACVTGNIDLMWATQLYSHLSLKHARPELAPTFSTSSLNTILQRSLSPLAWTCSTP